MTSRVQTVRWHVFADPAALAATAHTRVVQAASAAIARHGAFDIVLAGGATPGILYHTLRDVDADWACWHIWFGDERCVPAGDPRRNSRMAGSSWLDHVAIPTANVHPIPAELGPREAAARYARDLRTVDVFDLVLLGLGEDGHTASLFPGHDWGEHLGAPDVIAVHDAPKPPPERVSLGAQRLAQAQNVSFLVQGRGKCAAIAAWKRGERIPAASIAPEAGVDVLLDMAADGEVA